MQDSPAILSKCSNIIWEYCRRIAQSFQHSNSSQEHFFLPFQLPSTSAMDGESPEFLLRHVSWHLRLMMPLAECRSASRWSRLVLCDNEARRRFGGLNSNASLQTFCSPHRLCGRDITTKPRTVGNTFLWAGEGVYVDVFSKNELPKRIVYEEDCLNGVLWLTDF